MDRGYELFCLADPDFYDSPLRGRRHDPDLEVAQRDTPAGWRREEVDDWVVYHPLAAALPPQGWKIHASACLDNAEEIAATIFDYCVGIGVSFKFVRSAQLLLLRNAKYADRASSGKFATIYPASEAQLESVLNELGGCLRGKPGPYILSDLQWDGGPLYVRYGGFAERYCVGDTGEQVLAIEDPDGRLVPDRRAPRFDVPGWVEMPPFLMPHLAARNAATVDEMPYQIDEALHFSNGGGLYSGVDRRSGRQVVLKEARPHAGLALDGSDAVTRLGRERKALACLAGLGVAPEILDHFELGGHSFLVLEKVDGDPLNTAFVFRYPLVYRERSPEELAAYTAWAVDVYERVEAAVDLVHDRGIVIGDLHPNNVLVKPDGAVVLVDFEAATPVEDWHRQTLADPGFMSPPGTSGFDCDRYALACMALYLFLPLPTLLSLAPAKADQFGRVIAQTFPVPDKVLSTAVETIAGRRRKRPPADWAIEPDEAGWHRGRRSMADAIASSATPDRDDRLYPGDVKQFATGGLNLAYGAAGVLYALAATGAGRNPEHEDWLARRAVRPAPGTRFGLYDGLFGVAYVLERLGRHAAALDVLDVCMREVGGNWSEFGSDLYGGLTGMALALMHLSAATGEQGLSDAASSIAGIVADRLGPESAVPELSGGAGGYAGLLRGSSGPALLFIRLFEETGVEDWLDLAGTALAQDLRRCIARDDGAYGVNEGWRTMPYLAEGSVGIGMVLDDYLRHRRDDHFEEASAGIRRAAEAQFYIEPGLFSGRSGMILYLSRKLPGGRAHGDPTVAGHIRRLAWHALSYRGGLAFPGEQLLRLSMDLASGTAGVLLALGAALHNEPVSLPFLDARPAGGGPDAEIKTSDERR